MAKTKSSVRGVQNKKIVTVKGYTRKDGTHVGAHRRSTPNQSKSRIDSPGFFRYPGVLLSGAEYCII